MCDSLVLGGDDPYGDIFKLCPDAIAHIPLKILSINPRYLGHVDDGSALRGVLAAFVQQAAYLVLEYNYFDIDYRSEFSSTHESSFKLRSYDVVRLHFFKAPEVIPGFHLRDFVKGSVAGYLGYWIFRPQVPGCVGRSIVTTEVVNENLKLNTTLAHHVRTAVREYVQLFGVRLQANGVAFMEQDGHLLRCAHVSSWICHYSAVLRGLVGRRSTAEFHGPDDDRYWPYGRVYPSPGLNVNVLTASLRRVGLPPEVIHYGILQERRKPQWYDRLVTYWPESNDETDSAKRFWIEKNFTENVCRYLNSGVPCILSREEISHTQVIIGYLRKEDMRDGDKVPAHESELGEDTHGNVEGRRLTAVQGAATTGQGRLRGDRPLISISSNAEPELLVEETDDADIYLRQYTADDLEQMHSDVTHLIVSDDQEGPFVLVPLSEIVDEIADYSTTCVVTPLPRALLLSGSVAEGYAGLLFSKYAKDHFSEWEENSSDQNVRIGRDFYENTHNQGLFTIRTYATTGADFKESWAERFADVSHSSTANDDAIRLVGHLPLPKYVWVSEATDRRLRHSDMRDVVWGTIVFDAFEVALDPEGIGDIVPLFIHIPGNAYAPPPADWMINPDEDSDEIDDALDDQDMQDDRTGSVSTVFDAGGDEHDSDANSDSVVGLGHRVDTAFVPYRSGRHKYKGDSYFSAERLAERVKTTTGRF